MTFSLFTVRLSDPEILQNFFDWLRDLMLKCGGKDAYHLDGSPIKGVFEGFGGSSLERLNAW